MTSIQKENEDLKSRLKKFEVSFNELLSIALGSNLPPTQFKIVQSLAEVAQQHSHLQSLDKVDDDLRHSTDCHKDQSRPLEPQDSSTNIPSTILASSQIINGPYLSTLDQVPVALMPFALRLRIEGLKHGYHLIQDPEASFESLRQAFQHHIFSETRDGILKRIHRQLDQTVKYLYLISETRTRKEMGIGNLWQPSAILEAPLEGSSLKFPESAEYHSMSELEPTNEEILLDDGQLYVYSGRVEKLLLERGLSITASSHFIRIPAGSRIGLAAAPTMFDEIRGNRELKLSVHNLAKSKFFELCEKTGLTSQ